MLTNHLPEAAQPTLRCPGCKHANPAHSNFCNICGRGLPSVPCPQCGEMNDLAMATMCSRCGGPLTDRADSEAAKDARLRVIEAAMGGGFPPMAVARATADAIAASHREAPLPESSPQDSSVLAANVGVADQRSPVLSPSPSPVDLDVDMGAVGAVSTSPAAAPPAPAAIEARPPAPPIPADIPTLTAAIGTPVMSSPMATAAPVAATTSASPWASKPAAAMAPLPSGGPPAPSLARMPRSSEPPALGAANPIGASASAQPSPTLADFGPSAFNLPHLNAGHSANSAPFVLTGWRTEEPQRADFDMRQITELVRTSLAAETVPMLPALSSGGAAARSEPEPPPGRVAPRPRRLVMAGGAAAAVVVAVLAYRVYGPARVPELTPVPLAGGGAATTATATAAVDSKAAQMQVNLDRAAELLAQKPTGAGVDVAALSDAAPAASAAPSPAAVILPTTLAPSPSPGTRQETPGTARPTPPREPAVAIAIAAARPAKAPAITYKAQPAPAARPCTEGVAALGLCDAVTSPANSRR